MNKKISKFGKLIITFCLIVFHGCASSYAFPAKALNKSLQSALDIARHNYQVRAIAVSVILPYENIVRNFTSAHYSAKTNSLITSTLFDLGNNSDSFISTIALELVAAKKLSLNAKLTKYLPKYKKWQNIKIKQLLNNTSDIGTKAKLLGPEKSWHYNKTNTELVAEVIEKVTGKPIATLINQQLLGAHNLNLVNLYFYSSSKLIPKHTLSRLARGYSKTGKQTTKISLTDSSNLGVLLGNSQSLVTWAYNLFNARVIPQQQLDEMMEPALLVTGKAAIANAPAGYGLGITLYSSDVGKWWGNSALTPGYHSIFAWFPKYDIFIAVTANAPTPNLNAFVSNIAAIILAYDTT